VRILAVGNVYPPHTLGGYEIVWEGAMDGLRAAGHQTRILTTDFRAPAISPGRPEDPRVHRELRWYWHDHDWPAMTGLQRLRLERHNARVFDRHLRQFAPDVVSWWPMGGMSLSLIERARRRSLPSVLFVHDYWPVYGPDRDLWTRAWSTRPWAGRVAERLTGIPTASCIATSGRWLFNAECVRERTVAAGLPVADSDLLPPGISRAYLQAAKDSPGDWDWQLLYLGRVVEQKGVHTAIQALPMLPGRATLTVLGDGDRPYGTRLREMAQALGVSDRVRFEPARPSDELIPAYRACDAVIFPVQWAEPWGLVPLEAMALGRPVIATGRGGSGDYLRDGSNSVLFEAGDPASLAQAVTRVANSPALRERIRTGGLETAVAYSEQKFNRRAIEEILQCADRRTLPRRPRRGPARAGRATSGQP
jgi:glycogen(starch) synthase